MTTLLTNAFLLDCTGDEPRERASVMIEGGRISEVRSGGPPPTGGHHTVIDCAGMTLLPGLTDAHVHIGAVEVNILDQHREHPSNLVALMMARILEDTLQSGFTTVRDAGGTDWSFKAAIERGIVDGPRLLISDRPLSQTGGHGDWRRAPGQGQPEAHHEGRQSVQERARGIVSPSGRTGEFEGYPPASDRAKHVWRPPRSFQGKLE